MIHDTSDALVRRMQLKTLNQFARLLGRDPNVAPAAKEALAHVVAKHGIGSVEYDECVRSIAEDLRRGNAERGNMGPS